MQLQPYLFFDGHCAEAFRFYQRVFGGTLDMITHGDSPLSNETPAEWRDRIMHARLEVGDAVLMGSDVPPDEYKPPQGCFVSIGVDAPAEADRIFHELEDGGRVIMPVAETFWSPRFGMLVDRYGVSWMVNCAPAEKPAVA